MRRVEATPFLGSMWDSMTKPSAFLFLLPEKFSMSAARTMRSSRSSMPLPFFAEIGVKDTSPPSPSSITPFSSRDIFALSMSAFGVSILLNATTNGILAVFIASRASLVCALTPSSAETTRTAMSASSAP